MASLMKKVSTRPSFFLQAVGGLASEDARRAVPHNRLVLAARYISGEGIEIGGLGRTLPVPPGARVKYLDRYDRDGLHKNFPELSQKRLVQPDIVDDGETLSAVRASSQDFLIVNHVVEHFQNPILFFQNAMRVLKPRGILFLALPEKNKTFDRVGRSHPSRTSSPILKTVRNIRGSNTTANTRGWPTITTLPKHGAPRRNMKPW